MLYPDEKGSVTLLTSKHQECFTFLRPSWDAMSEDQSTVVRRDLVPDMRPDSVARFPLYRPEPANTLARLDEVRPSVLYVFGGTSDMSSPEQRARKMALTGSGTSGSGGAKEGRVKEVVLDGIGHLVAMEATEKCADAAATWLGQELERFWDEKRQYVEWTKQGLEAKSTMSEEWKNRVGGPLKRSKI